MSRSGFGFFIKPGPGSGFFNPYPILFLIRPDKIRLIKVGPDWRVGKKLSSYLQIRNKNTLKKILKDYNKYVRTMVEAETVVLIGLSIRQNFNCLNPVVNSFEVDLSLSLSLSLYIYIRMVIYVNGWMDAFHSWGEKKKEQYLTTEL